jgi:hypothetical protein
MESQQHLKWVDDAIRAYAEELSFEGMTIKKEAIEASSTKIVYLANGCYVAKGLVAAFLEDHGYQVEIQNEEDAIFVDCSKLEYRKGRFPVQIKQCYAANGCRITSDTFKGSLDYSDHGRRLRRRWRRPLPPPAAAVLGLRPSTSPLHPKKMKNLKNRKN